ncbi:unnamed protein product [Closterium sp. NIES-65]|nr:unnamed protein product [Closterium sp. NIES-65]
MAPAVSSFIPPLSSLPIPTLIRESRSRRLPSALFSRGAVSNLLLLVVAVLLFAVRLTPPVAALPHYGAVPGGSCPMNDWSENGYWGALEVRTQVALAVAQEWRDAANEALGKFEPLQLLVAALLAAVVGGKLAQVAGAAAAQIRYQGLVPSLIALFFSLIRLVPGVKAYVEEQQAKVRVCDSTALPLQIKARGAVDGALSIGRGIFLRLIPPPFPTLPSARPSPPRPFPPPRLQARAQIAGGGSSSKERAQWRKKLPDVGAEADEVLGEMRALRDKDKQWQGRCSGTVYVGGESYEKHMKLISDAYTFIEPLSSCPKQHPLTLLIFSTQPGFSTAAHPSHLAVFPSIARSFPLPFVYLSPSLSYPSFFLPPTPLCPPSSPFSFSTPPGSGTPTPCIQTFQHTNPLHPDVFPSITRFEAEVVAMTAALLGGGDGGGSDGRAEQGGEKGAGDAGGKGGKGVKGGAKGEKGGAGREVCGNMTSGGSESILMAVKAARDYMRAKKGITRPEMIVPVSAHAAYDKAAEYFQVHLLRAPVADDWCVEVDAVRRLCSRNTVLIVASAPGFPHGIIDPIPELGEIALRWGTCLHVDCCLGGFVLPFAKKLGYPLPPFDFSVPGVTSMSVDCHKYGLAPKGTSVVLYRNREIRKHQFCAVTEWSGGLYVSPTVSGSRSGALIAGAWAAMRGIGMQGYMDITKRLMEASKAIVAGVSCIKGLQVVGEPDMTVIAMTSDELDIYRVNDAMSHRGWALSALHKPASIHLCVTLQHVGVVDAFLADLQAAVDEVRSSPSSSSQGMAPIYGAGNRMPDRGAVKELLLDYMDSLT